MTPHHGLGAARPRRLTALVLAVLAMSAAVPHVVSGVRSTRLVTSQTAVVAQTDEVKRRLLGEWTLVKYEVFGENGETRPGTYDVARINYGEREMSAHLMRTGGAKEAPTTEPSRAAAYQRYLGYFGPYTIDVGKQTVTHHVAGSSFPHWIGSEQVRHYAFTPNGHLTLSLKSGERVAQTLTWARTR